MSHTPPESPVNPLPPLVLILFLAMLAVESVLSMGARGFVGGPEAVGWRLAAIERFGFSADVLTWMWQNARWPPDQLVRFFSYPFIHASFTHAIFAGVILLAMGKMVAETFGQWAMAAIFVLSGIGGALGYSLLVPEASWLIGGFPPVYGLIGAFTYLLWRSLAGVGANQARAFNLIGILMGIQLLFGLFFGTDNTWMADLCGFATGFGLSFFVSPGGWARLRGRRQFD